MRKRLTTLLWLLVLPSICRAQPPDPPANPPGLVRKLGLPSFQVTAGFGVALSPDGRYVATGVKISDQNRVLVWDADAQKPFVLGEGYPVQLHGDGPAALAYSEYGRLVAGVDSRTKFQVWNLPTKKLLWRDKERPEADRDLRVRAFRFVDDDKLLAVAYTQWGFGGKPEVELREADSGKRISLWKVDQVKKDAAGEKAYFHDVALSPTGAHMAWLATGPRDAKQLCTCTVLVGETATGKLLAKVVVKELPWTIQVDLPDEGQTLVLIPFRSEPVTSLKTAAATVVNVADGRTKFTFPYRFRPTANERVPYGVTPEGLQHPIDRRAVRFRDSLLTFDEAGLTRWDFKTGKKLEEFVEPFGSFSIARDGERIAVREGARLGLSRDRLASLSGGPSYSRPPLVRFLADGRLIGFEPPIAGDAMLHVWQPRSGACLQSERLFAFPSQAYLDRCDTWGKTLVYPRYDGTPGFAIFDLTTNQRIAAGALRGEQLYQLSGDGKRVLAAGHEKNRLNAIRWFDAESTRSLGRLDITSDVRADQVQWFSEDGSKLGYVTENRQLALMDGATRDVRLIGNPPSDGKNVKLEYKSVGFHRVIWSRPARRPGEEPPRELADHALYDHEGRNLRRFTLSMEHHPGQLLLSPDARTLAVNLPNQQIVCFETITNRPRGRIPCPMPVLANLPTHHRADISPDGKLLAASHANVIWVWDLARPLADKPVWPEAKNAGDAERLWELLGAPDPIESDRALWALASSGQLALELLRKRLPTSMPKRIGAQRLQELIVQLDSTVFNVRAAADKELHGARMMDLPALRAARKKGLSLEQGRRIEEVIARIEARENLLNVSSELLRDLRGLEVLERIGGHEARRLVQAVAVGADGLRATEAQFILARWR